MKRHRKEKPFLDQLAEIPNVSLACERVGIARNTIYRWCREDPDFKSRVDDALASGVDSINDLAESKLVTHINGGNMRAIQYWLDNHKKEYIKPRDKYFWSNMTPPVSAIIIQAVDEDEVRREREEMEKERQRLNGEN